MEVRPPDMIREGTTSLTAMFEPAAGENNQLTVRREGGATVFTEAVLPVTAGDRCTQRTPSSASCAAPSAMWLATGDGDDRVDDDVSARVEGGPGNDTLTGTGAVVGGPGQDTFMGKVLRGTPSGNALGLVFIDGGPRGERDTYVGTVGDPTVSYEGRRTPLRIDLRRDTNEDRFVSVRSIQAGEADDLVVGDGRDNSLTAGGGRDRLVGGAGDDLLAASGDDDRATLSGGPGNDTLAFASRRDRVSCGSGLDVLTAITEDARASVPRDCEQVQYGDEFLLRGAPRRRAGHIDMRVDHVDTRGHRIALFSGRRFLGHSRPVGRKGIRRIALNRAGRRLAARGRLVDVRSARAGEEPGTTIYRYSVR